MCSHYLVDPVACTPASGWEKGQVENQVGLVRERFFTPRLRFKNYDELNAWLLEVHAYADRVVIRQDGRIVAEHSRSFGRGETLYDPWHYVPVLARKPGALRNGAPFKDWVLPAAMERVRRKLAGADDGNRQMVDILTAVLIDGLPAVETACAEAIAHGVHSADVVLNILARQRDPGPSATILTPAALTLRHAPVADCARYDNLRRTI